MPYFEYNQTVKNVEYYEILGNLMERWEYEIAEFKEAGWLVFGVGEEQGN